jgi:hypothetical protein
MSGDGTEWVEDTVRVFFHEDMAKLFCNFQLASMVEKILSHGRMTSTAVTL